MVFQVLKWDGVEVSDAVKRVSVWRGDMRLATSYARDYQM